MLPNSTSTARRETRTQRQRSPSVLAVAKIVLFSFLALGTKSFLCGLSLSSFAKGTSVAQSRPEEVVFASDGRELHGFLWKPEGTGPFRRCCGIMAARNCRALNQS